MSPLLRFAEYDLQVAALAFMAVVYALRLRWFFRFRSPKERSRPVGRSAAGVGFSLVNGLLPWGMESSRAKPGNYVQFAVFHLGVAAAIFATFVIPYAPGLFRSPLVLWAFRVVIGAAGLVGLWRLARRIGNKALRLVSSPDDYASLALMILYFAAGVLALTLDPGRSELPLLAFFGLTALFLVYVPFSKIGHYLYYPFTHFFLGRSLGRRGVYPLGRRSPVERRVQAGGGR